MGKGAQKPAQARRGGLSCPRPPAQRPEGHAGHCVPRGPLPGREPTGASTQRMGGNAEGRNSPLHFTPLSAGTGLPRIEGQQQLKRPGTRGARPHGARGRPTKHTSPQAGQRAAAQSPAEICKLITELGNLGGDTTQDASCSAEIREFPGSPRPRGTESWGELRGTGESAPKRLAAGKLPRALHPPF